ncbi:alpha/beta hydrolase [Nocardia sp. NPDC052566]|uniref:alpha/beta hydrolase n=1 Tax=Nocardia sp. NPDC052566 TaxID=3364330 RepID=UPI0037C7B824
MEISWPLDSTTVYGSAIRPDGPGPFPAAVLVAGSGPTDRDWNSPLLPGANGSGKLIAEVLARNGFASVRYDKRGIGPHGVQQLDALVGKVSMQSFADELAGAVRAAAEQLNSERIFAVANSEGALHALHYQLRKPEIPLAGMVLIAPPGRVIGAVARSQLAAQAARLPNSDELLELFDQAIDRFLAGQPVDPDPALPEGLQQLLRSLETPINLPFTREFWTADAAELLGRIDIPVLVVIGKKDIQVDWQADGDPLRRVAGTNVQFLFPENANHVLKQELRPRSDLTIGTDYNSPDALLDPQAMAAVTAWLASVAATR